MREKDGQGEEEKCEVGSEVENRACVPTTTNLRADYNESKATTKLSAIKSAATSDEIISLSLSRPNIHPHTPTYPSVK